MNGRRAFSILVGLVLLVPAVAVFAQKPAATAPRRAAATVPAPGSSRGPAVARVGGAPLTREELDARTQQALAQYRQSSGERQLPREMTDLLRRQVLESMIRLQLMTNEAERTGVRGTAEEAEAALRQAPVFNPGGRFDAARYDGIKTTQRPAYDAAIATIQKQLGARKLYAQLEARYAPSEAEARASAARLMSRALVDHLSLRAGDFSGAYPEPREQQVLEWYATHRADYQRPDRATLTVAFVKEPALTDAEKRVPGSVEAWTRRMRVKADSVLARMSAGASFDSATAGLGAKASIIVARDNFPGYWRGTEAQAARLFDARNTGKPVPEAIAANEGWLVVRVDEIVPSHVAPLREVAREIRAALRRDQRLHHDEYEQRALYAIARDSLAGTGVRLRYAGVDTSTLAVPEPADAELERWYRSHIAEYSSFDAATGVIVSRTFDEVRDDARARWKREQKLRAGRELTEQIRRAWSAGKRDAAAEARAIVRETGAIIPGSAIDTGLVAASLADTLWKMEDPSGTGTIVFARGWIVWTALGRVEHVIPTFEQARPALAVRLAARRDALDLAEARRLFSSDSMRFNQGQVIHFTRFAIEPPPLMTVKLTHDEVEKWQHDHMERYSAPELVTARHILVRTRSGSPEDDRAARAKAEDLLRRAQAGEDFATLAKTNSEDPATKDAGGDLGAFGRGTMLAEFERAAFALNAGELCDHVVKTEVGYHVIKCTDHVSAFVQPLPLIYSTVAMDAARDRAEAIARRRADSLLAAARTPAALRAAAKRYQYPMLSQTFQVNQPMNNPTLQPFFDRLVKLAPGGSVSPPVFVKGEGYWTAWVDSITPPVAPTWEAAREQALLDYRRGAGRRALQAKQAELDSMLAAGWTLDSLATLWGGYEHALDVTPSRGLAGLGASAEFDSLVFGTAHSAPLANGATSGWLAMPNGVTRIKLIDRVPAPADQLAARAAGIRNAELERRLRGYFDDLKKRWPVTILDASLRDVSLAEPPPGLTP